MQKNQDERVFYRNEIKEKNKEIVKICYYNGGNYQGCFVQVQKAIIGEYTLNKFNEKYNADTTKKHKSIINYLSLENLKEYLEKLQLIIDEARNNDISISQAISNLKLKNQLTPIYKIELEENISNKANKKAKEIDKEVSDKLEQLIDEKELIEELNNQANNKKSKKTKKDRLEEEEEEIELYEQFAKEQAEQDKKKKEIDDFLNQTDYLTDDYYDYLTGKGDYEKE